MLSLLKSFKDISISDGIELNLIIFLIVNLKILFSNEGFT